jgi:hypothetical protein
MRQMNNLEGDADIQNLIKVKQLPDSSQKNHYKEVGDFFRNCTMNFRNFKMIGYVVYGRGAFNQLDEILQPNRKADAPMIFLVDIFSKAKNWLKEFPQKEKTK